MHARGMTTRKIVGHLKKISGSAGQNNLSPLIQRYRHRG